jgi:hypothetical protein
MIEVIGPFTINGTEGLAAWPSITPELHSGDR